MKELRGGREKGFEEPFYLREDWILTSAGEE